MTLPDNVLTKMRPEDRKLLGKAGITAEEAENKLTIRRESDLQKLISQDLRRRNIPFFQNAMHKRHTGTIGEPDFIVFFHGSLLLIEVKFGKGKLSPEQAALHAELALQGFEVNIVTTFQQYHRLINGGKA